VARTSPAAVVLPPSCTKLPSATPSRTSDRPVASTSPPLLTQTYVVSDYYVFFCFTILQCCERLDAHTTKNFPPPISCSARGSHLDSPPSRVHCPGSLESIFVPFQFFFPKKLRSGDRKCSTSQRSAVPLLLPAGIHRRSLKQWQSSVLVAFPRQSLRSGLKDMRSASRSASLRRPSLLTPMEVACARSRVPRSALSSTLPGAP
jgi:hypothetical protein